MTVAKKIGETATVTGVVVRAEKVNGGTVYRVAVQDENAEATVGSPAPSQADEHSGQGNQRTDRISTAEVSGDESADAPKVEVR